jgi:hypothetical protein
MVRAAMIDHRDTLMLSIAFCRSTGSATIIVCEALKISRVRARCSRRLADGPAPRLAAYQALLTFVCPTKPVPWTPSAKSEKERDPTSVQGNCRGFVEFEVRLAREGCDKIPTVLHNRYRYHFKFAGVFQRRVNVVCRYVVEIVTGLKCPNWSGQLRSVLATLGPTLLTATRGGERITVLSERAAIKIKSKAAVTSRPLNWEGTSHANAWDYCASRARGASRGDHAFGVRRRRGARPDRADGQRA